jgi:hypothetical protein
MSQADLHGFVAGGAQWRVLPEGVAIGHDAPMGTPGAPDTVRRVLGWFKAEIEAGARAFGVPAPLLVAIICNESAGGQTDRDAVVNARREEPGWVSDDASPGRVSVGCCQTLLSTARAALYRPKLTTADLADPGMSIMAAAAFIASQHRLTGFDPVLVAAAYNAGGLHFEDTRTNRWGLRCYPLNTGAYIDRFVLWYNDAVAVLA